MDDFFFMRFGLNLQGLFDFLFLHLFLFFDLSIDHFSWRLLYRRLYLLLWSNYRLLLLLMCGRIFFLACISHSDHQFYNPTAHPISRIFIKFSLFHIHYSIPPPFTHFYRLISSNQKWFDDCMIAYKHFTYLMSQIVSAFIFTIFTIFALYLAGAFHVIDTGHIGVYKRGGAMLSSWTEPGLHFMLPFVTKYHQVQVTLQTDQVRDIPCGTSSGVILKFDKIEVVNRLRKSLAHATIKNYTVSYDQTWIFSKIHHEINQFCSGHTVQEVLIDKFNTLDESLRESLQAGCEEWAPGIEIIAVRVTKPTVPDAIAKSYEEREVERTKLLIKKEEQKLREKESEIEKKISKIQAETENKISEINNHINLAEKEANKEIASIENSIVVIKETALAKSQKYRQQKLIELNKKRLIPQKELENYLKNIKNSHKVVYQKNIESYLNTKNELLQSAGIILQK